MIPVFVVDRQKVLIIQIKLPPALRTDQPVDFEGLPPIITAQRIAMLQFLYNISNRFGIAFICRVLPADSEGSFLSHRMRVLMYSLGMQTT